MTPLLPLLCGLTALVAYLLFPLLIRYSPNLRLMDVPNDRKVHYRPVPSIGGLVVALALLGTLPLNAPLRGLLAGHPALAAALLALLIIGILDDRLNLPARGRLLGQAGCALLVAYDGGRLTSLHGLLGITDLPLVVQYSLTVLILAGMANAMNLLDGVDGLAGSLGLSNLLLFGAVAWWLGQPEWLFLLLPLAAALGVFLRFNWQPARVFMGDGGSLVLGFLTAVLGIQFIEQAAHRQPTVTPLVVVVVTAGCMIPVMDTLRVFWVRLRAGRSPFSADKNHLHHWLLRHRIAHAQVTTRLTLLHITLIVGSAVAIQLVGIATVIVAQALLVVGYTYLIQISHLFLRSFRLIKRLEVR